MRILLYGETDQVGSGAWCYAETLRDMGHHVIGFQEDRYLAKYRTSIPLRLYRRLARRPRAVDLRAISDRLLSLATEFRPQIVIILKGLHVSVSTVRALQEVHGWVVNINHDDFFSRNPNNWSKLQRAATPAYNYILTTREVNVGEVAPFNPDVEFFPFAYFPRIHRKVPLCGAERELQADVIFVGTWERRRAELLEHLVHEVPARYAIFGSQWKTLAANSPLRKYVRTYELIGDDMAKAIGGAKVALGFLRKENRDEYTQRTFEIPACGGVLLAERTTRHLAWFTEGRDAEFFDPNEPPELCQKVRGLLENHTLRERIRVNGSKNVAMGKHTYRDRLERLIGLYQVFEQRRRGRSGAAAAMPQR